MRDSSFFSALAQSILAGEASVDLITVRCTRALGRSWRWVRPLAQRYLASFAGRIRPRHRDVVVFLKNDQGLRRAWSKYSDVLWVDTWLTEPQQMQPVAAAEAWDLPAIDSVGDLASWFGLEVGELRWFADLKALEYKGSCGRLAHYHYRVLAKKSGGIRLIEAPKPRLKDLQRQILLWILGKIPPHPAVHGFVKRRSIKTFVAPHVGQHVVLRLDLRDFFPTFGGPRVQAIFRTLGYPESVADLLGGICTNATPCTVWNKAAFDTEPISLAEARRLYSRPHLPQGAPTSPALANVCCYRLDCRLTALARSAGCNYTRYADDLAFSGGEEFEKKVERFGLHAAAILLEEGFTVNHRKTRVMRQGVRQHLAGLVTNQRMNVARSNFDQLKAILTNCVQQGPESQNREFRPHFRLHLDGRVGFVETINPSRGKRLRTIFNKIQWPS